MTFLPEGIPRNKVAAEPVYGGEFRTAEEHLYLLFPTGLTRWGWSCLDPTLHTVHRTPGVFLRGHLGAYLWPHLSARRRTGLEPGNNCENWLAWISLALLGLLPLLTSDLRVPLNALFAFSLGVMPFAGMIGFLTPMLVDRWSAGDPDRAGRAYAVNVVGCIAGPLISGFVLLPLAGEEFPCRVRVALVRRARAERLQPRCVPAARATGYALLVAALSFSF